MIDAFRTSNVEDSTANMPNTLEAFSGTCENQQNLHLMPDHFML